MLRQMELLHGGGWVVELPFLFALGSGVRWRGGCEMHVWSSGQSWESKNKKNGITAISENCCYQKRDN